MEADTEARIGGTGTEKTYQNVKGVSSHASSTIAGRRAAAQDNERPAQTRGKPLHLDLAPEAMIGTSTLLRETAKMNVSDHDIDEKHVLPVLKPIDRAAFTSSTFSVEAYLASQKHISLEELRGDLRAHLQTLKDELLDLINEDYRDFISLGSDLRGVDAKLIALRAPLVLVGSKAATVKEMLTNVQTELQKTVQAKRLVRDRKLILKSFIHIERNIRRLERLLVTFGKQNEREKSLKDTVFSMDRAAREMAIMETSVERLPASALRASMRERLRGASESLLVILSQNLQTTRRCIDEDNSKKETWTALSMLLQIFSRIDRLEAAETVLRKQTQSAAQAVVKQCEQIGSSEPVSTASAADQVKATLDGLLVLARAHATVLRNVTRVTPDSGDVSLYNTLLRTTIVDAVLSASDDGIGKALFSVARTATFHQNYTCGMSFLSDLERLADPSFGSATFAKSIALDTWLKKWQLQVYFQLRLKEVIAKTEAILLNNASIRVTESMWRDRKDGHIGPLLSPTRAITDALTWCWSDAVFLEALTHRFWTLSLQLLKRYRTWIDLVLDLGYEGQGQNKQSREGDRPQNTVNRPLEEDEEVKLNQMTVAVFDIKLMQALARKTLEEAMQSKMTRCTEEVRQQLLAALNHTLRPLLELQARVSAHIISIVSKRCTDQLLLVRSISGQYRHTKKARPTEPSYFIPNILKPLRNYRSGVGSLLLSNEADSLDINQWTRDVLDEVGKKYAIVTTDIFTSIKKAEDSLRRFQRGKKTGFSLFGNGSSQDAGQDNKEDAISDEDKIRAQMVLDVKAYLSANRQFGVGEGELAGQRSLLEAIEGQ